MELKTTRYEIEDGVATVTEPDYKEGVKAWTGKRNANWLG